MTKPKTGITGKLFSPKRHAVQQNAAEDIELGEDMVETEVLHLSIDSNSLTQTDNPPDGDDLEDEVDSCSSFSLQECINEFRARRIRRTSTHSRDILAGGDDNGLRTIKTVIDPADADLINQNRSNKEQERKCKPCKNGFCYCFTSDSGDGGGLSAAIREHMTRGLHARQQRRSRKSESGQLNNVVQQKLYDDDKSPEQRRRSAPANLKSVQKPKTPQKCSKFTKTSMTTRNEEQLTAVSRMTTTSKDAPLIHIIQELRNNCVISEVRVNRQKLQAQRSAYSLSARTQKTASPKKMPLKTDKEEAKEQPTTLSSPLKTKSGHKNSAYKCYNQPEPTAPPLEQINESCTDEAEAAIEEMPCSTSLDSGAQSDDKPRRRHSAGGRLLQKRLKQTNAKVRPQNFTKPPPKPPRASVGFNEKCSVSTLASTSSSVREAERVLDDFLRKNGVKLPGEKQTKTLQSNTGKKSIEQSTQCYELDFKKAPVKDKRRSYPLTQTDMRSTIQKPLSTYPSLSDIERVVDSKKSSFYSKNICQVTEKPVKELSFGWQEPKITEMLNYESNGKQKEFKSQASQAGPQTIGWQMPPKMTLDAVDGVVGHNLASNIENKDTPVKRRLFPKQNGIGSGSKKLIWGEQWRNLSPWSAKYKCTTRKSNLKSNTGGFFTTSKKKILRLVSPKKQNKVERSFVAVAVQTTPEDKPLYEPSITPQSPLGSYHSAVQTSQQSSTTTPSQIAINDTGTQFNFERTVQPPPKQAPRIPGSQRKLHFPLNCSNCHNRSYEENVLPPALSKSYRSYHADLDQDVTITKMGSILNNIRARLEASDEHAIRTFQEIERRENSAPGVDVPDNYRCPNVRAQTSVEVHRNHIRAQTKYHEPIYSEIEEDSIHISEGSEMDNKTGIETRSTTTATTTANVELLYAKVNKPAKVQKSYQTPIALGKLLHDSLKQQSKCLQSPPLPPLPEPVDSEVSYATLPTAPSNSSSELGQSLNNIRVMEHNSPPKYQRNLSKSDLSLQRSEIFLDNLCRSQIIVEHGELERLEKIDNHELHRSRVSLQNASAPINELDDTVSYAVPNEYGDLDDVDSIAAGIISPPSSRNQSTPKKEHTPSQSFTTKPLFDDQSSQKLSAYEQQEKLPLNIDVVSDAAHLPYLTNILNQSSSCPITPTKRNAFDEPQRQHLHAASMIEISCIDNNQNNNNNNYNNATNFKTLALKRYECFKNVVQKSLRRSKSFVKTEVKRLSVSLNLPVSNSLPIPSNNNSLNRKDLQANSTASLDSTFDLEALFALHENVPVIAQIAQAVSICRQLPELEISLEMVEAERLLLYSTLRRDAMKQQLSLVKINDLNADKQHNNRRFFIDEMKLPIKANPSQDIFFNYFYICTFNCGGVIKSTQSAECCNYMVIFRDCGIEFMLTDNMLKNTASAEIHCDVFMLRLRKVSTLALEPRKPIIKLPAICSPNSTASSSGAEEVVSRFRLHASFTLKALDFAPYEYVESESKKCDIMCLRASNSCVVPLTLRRKSTNLTQSITLTGRTEVRLPKPTFNGFLNVQDPHSQHNWNRRWCTLDGLRMNVWNDVNIIDEKPLFEMYLYDSVQTIPLCVARRELCARMRAFCLQCAIKKAEESIDVAAVFFAADTQEELENWLLHLNEVLKFIRTWLCVAQ